MKQKAKTNQSKLKKKLTYECKCTVMTILAVLVSSFSLHIFVIPADFAPSGVDGISTMLYEVTGLNIGWYKIIINVPLLVLACIFLNRRYAIYTALYTLLDSVALILLERFNFYTFIPAGLSLDQALSYRLIASIFAGVALGVTSGMMLKMGFSTGGTDIIASLVHKKKPHLDTERVISVLCYIIIGCSYFVYWDVTSILLSVIQIFVFEVTASALLKSDRYAVEVKVITKEPERIRDIVLYDFEHSATILQAEGMYSGEGYKMLITLMTERELIQFIEEMKKYPDTFLYYSGGVRVKGDFQFNEHNIQP